MNILIVSATEMEIKPFIYKTNIQTDDIKFPTSIHYKKHKIDIFITGIGSLLTTYDLTRVLRQHNYDLIINAGIAGSFNRNISIGEVVLVVQEEFGDLGIEDSNGFRSAFEMNFIKLNEFPFTNGQLKCILPASLKELNLKSIKGLTSNTAHGNQNTINQLINKFNPDIETMEGAAFFYVCLMEKVNFIGIRAISNFVETRDKSKWNIPLATENLSNKLIQIIESL
jgi:futalosine hydrolase